MPTDPPVRPDGRCALEECGRRVVRTKQARKYAGQHLLEEPFCSRRCCEIWYGLEEPMTEAEMIRSRAGQINADRYRASRAETARY